MDGFSNLSAMEIDPNGSIQDLLREHGEGGGGAEEAAGMGFGGGVGGMMQDLAFSVCFPFSFFLGGGPFLPFSPKFSCSYFLYEYIIWGVGKGGRRKVCQGTKQKRRRANSRVGPGRGVYFYLG